MLKKEKKIYKCKTISLRLSESEYNEIKMKCRLYKLKSMSEFIRHLIHNYGLVLEEKEATTAPSLNNTKDKPQMNL